MGQAINYFHKSYGIPYEKTLSSPISFGSQVHMYGVPQGDRFEINLVDHRGDVLLHVNPRLLDRQLVVNAAVKGNWGYEDRYSMNLKRGQRFGVIILITPESFMIAINNQHIATFQHRLSRDPPHTVTVNGDVKLEHIEIYPPQNSV